LKSRASKMRLSPFLLRSALAVVLVLSLALAPYRAAAQTGSAAGPTATSESTPSTGAQPAQQAQQSDSDDQVKQFLHSPVVVSIARVLHLDVNTTAFLFLGINFGIIFLAIVIPLGRTMPKLFRKRKETLSLNLKDARTAIADANARLSAVEAKLSGLGEEMKKFRAQIEQESLEDEKRIKASIGEESARIVATAEQEIGVAAAAARRELRSFAAGLAIEHAEKQLALTPETDRALIAEFVASVGAESGSGKGGKN
jgi:F-type H+-transporting ATPase subunit b